MSRFVLAIDQGTSSSRAIVFDHEARICGIGQRELPQHFPQPGWVEHDPGEIWATQSAAIVTALRAAGATAADLVVVGITNLRDSLITRVALRNNKRF